jgi:hypothetical protein
MLFDLLGMACDGRVRRGCSSVVGNWKGEYLGDFRLPLLAVCGKIVRSFGITALGCLLRSHILPKVSKPYLFIL